MLKEIGAVGLGGVIPGPAKSGAASPTTLYRSNVSSELCFQIPRRYAAEMGPVFVTHFSATAYVYNEDLT